MQPLTVRKLLAVLASFVVVGAVTMPSAHAGSSPLLTDPVGDTTGFAGTPLPPSAPEDPADLLSGDIAFDKGALDFTIRVVDMPGLGDDIRSYHSFYFTYEGVWFWLAAHRVWATGQTDFNVTVDEGRGSAPAGTITYTDDAVTISVPLAELNQTLPPGVEPIEHGSVLTNVAMNTQVEPTVTVGSVTLPTVFLLGAYDVVDAAAPSYTVQ
jgi:hypothetical protein